MAAPAAPGTGHQPYPSTSEIPRWDRAVEDDALKEVVDTCLIGTGPETVQRLEDLVERTGADEVIIVSSVPDQRLREYSLTRLAALWSGVSGAAARSAASR